MRREFLTTKERWTANIITWAAMTGVFWVAEPALDNFWKHVLIGVIMIILAVTQWSEGMMIGAKKTIDILEEEVKHRKEKDISETIRNLKEK